MSGIFDEDIGDGLIIPERPDFSDDIRKFGAHTVSEKRENLHCWFYLDFYADPKRFAEITSMLKSHINGTHQIDSEFFYNMIKERFNKE